jgi:hypothetical protein
MSHLVDTIYAPPMKVSTATEKIIKKASHAFEKDNTMDSRKSSSSCKSPRGKSYQGEGVTGSVELTQNHCFGLINTEDDGFCYGLLSSENDGFSTIGSVVGVSKNPMVTAVESRRKILSI